jgi:hypothetical protein
MRLVSQRSEVEIRKERAQQDLERPLLALAANIIRIARGG